MNRNDQSHFAYSMPDTNIKRSTLSRPSKYLTTCNVGQIIPFYWDEILPGDTCSIKTNKLVRLQTLITPLMDDLFLDVYWFFCPNRVLWDHWPNFQGELSENDMWTATQYTIPQISAPTGGWKQGNLADYLGIPTKVDGFTVSALPIRAYGKIISDWFWDDNNQAKHYIYTGDNTVAGSDSNTPYLFSNTIAGGAPWRACKYRDYFTSCLPAPQRGNVATAPVNWSSLVNLPVVTEPGGDNSSYYFGTTANSNGMTWLNTSNVPPTNPTGTKFFIGIQPNYSANAGEPTTVNNGSDTATHNQYSYAPKNLVVPASALQSTGGVSVPDLRFAFQYQKYLERSARGGSRYVESIKAHFDTVCPDFRVQRSEYLGGNRVKLNVSQVVQTSETTATSPQGTLTAYSCTGDSHGDFSKSFTEHGILMGVAVVRYHHTYQQGLNKYWIKKDLLDFYTPEFANISEQPVYNSEIYLQGNSTIDNQVFGYNEAWADYRFKPSMATAEMRSNCQTPLDMWHLADKYSQLPSLSASWLVEDATNVDRALAITSQVSNQLLMDFYVENTHTRPMPVYSIPGLIDHH